jgi:hypothetical protein
LRHAAGAAGDGLPLIDEEERVLRYYPKLSARAHPVEVLAELTG